MFKTFFPLAIALILSLQTLAQDNTLNDFEQKLDSYKGKVVYVDFWASWCIPCLQSFPWMNEMQTKYADKNFTVLSVNLDAKRANVTKFLQKTPALFPIIYDPKGKIAKAFKLKGMPSSFIINKQGKIVSSHIGFNDEKKARYQQEIADLIAQ